MLPAFCVCNGVENDYFCFSLLMQAAGYNKKQNRMNKNTYCVIMAGGAGTRFWPISREKRPKQFLDILGTGKTFIRSTFERFASFVPAENFLVVSNSGYKNLVLEQIPELKPEQVLSEPLGRNTAPCIAYAAFRLKSMNPQATMIVTPSDHLILNEPAFVEVVEEAVGFASSHDALVTIGLQPTRPATGYGYIQVEQPICRDGINKVKTFTEKPNLELAQVFINSGEFFWNSGIFVWKTDVILNAIHELQPETYGMFASIDNFYNTPSEQEYINRIYPECKAISVDYGIMEKADNVYVRCGDFGWSDIGTWGSLYEYSPKDDEGNTNSDEAVLFDTKDCVVRMPEGKLAVIEGLDDYIVVDTDDVLMICPKANEQNIKKFIDTIRFTKGNKFL